MIKHILIWMLTFVIISSVVYGLNENTVAYYRSDINGNFLDSVGGTTPTIQGATFISPGIINASYEYDGSNDYVDTNTDSFGGTIDSKNDFSVDFWVNLHTVTDLDTFISNLGMSNLGFVMYLTSGGTIRTRLYDGSSHQFDSNSTVPTGVWTYITYTREGSYSRIYINGVLDNTAELDINISGSSDDFLIGAWFNNGRNLDGAIDEIGIYNKTLTPLDISFRYNGGSPGNDQQYLFSETSDNFTIFVRDSYDSTNINNVTASITLENGSHVIFTNTTGNYITTSIPQNDALLANVTISSSEYYNTTLSNYNTSNNVIIELTQSYVRFGASAFLTNSAVPGNFTIGATTKATGEAFSIKAGTYDVIFSASGYNNKTQSITINALDNNTQILTNVTNNIINITAFDKPNNQFVSNFSIVIDSLNYSYSQNYTTTTGSIILNLTQGLFYNISINATGFMSGVYDIFYINQTSQSHQFDLYTTNAINFTFRDDNTNALITNNVSIELISEVAAYNYTTNNGTLYVDLIMPTTYQIEYSSPGYNTGFYTFLLTENTYNEITLYLSNSTTHTLVTITVVDEIGDPVEGAVLKIYKWNSATSSYELYESITTNFEGQAVFNAILNTQFYKFTIEYPIGTTKLTTQPTLIYSTELTPFSIVTGGIVGELFNTINNITQQISFNNVTDNFVLTYSDSESSISKMCLKVYQLTYSGQSLYNTSCSTSPAGTILTSTSHINGTSWRADAVATIDGQNYILDSLYHDFQNPNPTGQAGLFWVAMAMIVFACLGIVSPSIAVLLVPVPLTIGRIIGLVQLSPGTLISLHLISIVLAYLLSRK